MSWSDSINVHSDVVQLSMLAVVGGVVGCIISPSSYAYSGALVATGAAGIAYYVNNWSQFDRLWRNLNLGKGNAYPICKTKKETDTGTIYKFRLPAGLCLDDFEKHKQAIEQFVGRKVDLKYTYKEIWLEVFEKDLQEIYPFEVTECKGALAFPVGYTRTGKLITCNLADGIPHMLVAGSTGAGKSTALRSIIASLILTKPVKLHLVDLKNGAEFQLFAKCAKVKSFCRNLTETKKVLSELLTEIDKRYDLLFKNDVVNIVDYNKKGHRMGYEVLIIDEFSDIHYDKSCVEMLESIAAKARACGIHLIVATQRPDAQIINGRIKNNIGVLIGLRAETEIQSRIIMDEKGLEQLTGKGHAIYKNNGKKVEVRCPYLDPDRAKELVSPTYTQKKEAPIKKEQLDDKDLMKFLRGL